MFKSNITSFVSKIDKKSDEVDENMRIKVRKIVKFAHTTILSLTPVWSGQSIRNYTWSTGSDYTGGVLKAAGTSEPGATNSMPLGSEPRRGINEARPNATFAALDFNNPYRKYILTNSAPNIMALEMGLLPTEERSRSPAGMFGVTSQAISARLSSGKF